MSELFSLLSRMNRRIVVLGEILSFLPPELLEEKGISCFLAQDPYEAIRLLKQEGSMSLLLFEASEDYPRMDNFVEALHSTWPGLKVMALFLPAGGPPQRTLNRMKVDDFLVYPFTADELVEKVRSPAVLKAKTEKEGGGALEQRIALLESLSLFGHRLEDSLGNLEEFGKEVIDFSACILDAERVSLFFREKKEGPFILLASRGIEELWAEKPLELSPEGPASEVAKTGGLCFCGGKGRGPRGRGGPYRSDSFVIAPLSIQNEVLGVLNVTHKREGDFSKEDSEKLLAVASESALHLRVAMELKDLTLQSTIDPLTGLYNRRYFDSCLKVESIRAERYHRHLSLALLDIDDFKAFNDMKGHLAGDRILKEVAKVIKNSFRKVDIITRWGGEEFAIILPETTMPKGISEESEIPGRLFINRVRVAVEEHSYPEEVTIPGKPITISGGVATYPTDTRDVSSLFLRAQEALRKAKKGGKNRIFLLGEKER